MSTIVSKFLSEATGPIIFRAKLGVRTKPVTIFFGSLGTLNGIKAKVPESVLGGDIFSYFSQSLQQILQRPELPEQGINSVRSQKVNFSTVADRSNLKDTASFFKKSLSPNNSTGNFSPPLNFSESWEKPFSSTGFESRNRKKESYIEPEVSKSSKNPSILESLEHLRTHPSFPAENKSDEGIKKRRKRVNSVLIEKLNEYWHLTKQERKEKQHSITSPSASTGVNERSSFPAIPESRPAQRSWPQKAGTEAADKINSFISRRDLSVTPRRVQQTISTDMPDKVEIKNIFNIDLNNEFDRVTDFSTDLSQKIADILREQALQHGIDIT